MYTKIDGKSRIYYVLLTVLGILTAIGGGAFLYTFLHGHEATGMSNKVPWGLAIAVVVFLIGASAGSLMLSSLAYGFNVEIYKPLSRVSALLAIVLLVGALMMIMTDIGRPERSWQLFMMKNPVSLFAVNSFLYTSYLAICALYLRSMIKESMLATKILGMVAIPWAAMVHGGTGAIFGFIIARALWHSAMFSVVFLIAALVSGIAMLVIILVLTFKLTNRKLSDELIVGLGRYLAFFIVLDIFLIAIEGLAKIYGAEGEAMEFLMYGPYSPLVMDVQIFFGLVVPLIILFYPKTAKSSYWIIIASILAVVGVMTERYNIVVPSLVLPQQFTFEGHIAGYWGAPGIYSASPVELATAIGIISFMGLLYVLGLKLLELLPEKIEVKT